MGRFQPQFAEPSTVWLMRLIEAIDDVASSAPACEASVIEAFSNRLDLPATPLIPDGFRFRDHPTLVSANTRVDVGMADEHQQQPALELTYRRMKPAGSRRSHLAGAPNWRRKD
jgi:hypothetical protein